MRNGIYLATLLGAATVLVGGEREARACGGCFHPPPNPTETPTDVTDHRMILTISPTQTTLYDQIEYSGSPSSFAWVLPIASAGSVTIGLSADVVFGTLDALTQTTIVGPPKNCPPPPVCNNQNAGIAAPSFGNGGGGGSGGGGAGDGVTVVKQQTVGPYATVQLHSTDPTALNSWLTSNGFAVQTDEAAIITEYVNEHFDFLAMKLVPGANVTSMRPVRVTTPGASPVLPLRMVAAGTGATVGVTLWVLADGRYEPQNFPFFHIEDSDIAWDWNANASNYTTLRQQDEAALGGRGWEIESSIDLSSVTVQSGITSGGVINQGGFGGSSAPAENDYLAVPATSSTPGETADQVRQDDLTALFAGIGTTTGSVRVTRVRSDVAHTALTQDLALQASQDQSALSNQRTVTKELNEPLCPVYDGNCNQVGEAPRSQVANASQQSFACSTTEEPAAGWGLLAGLGGIAGLVAIRTRRSRRRAG